jgi:hypothetical protein
MQLKARRQRQRASTRVTRRVQRGGASWAEFKSGFGVRWAEWTAALKDNDHFAALFNDSAPPETKGSAWLNCIAYQEELFETSVKLIKAKLGTAMLQSDFSNAAAVDSVSKDVYVPYIKDVERFIQFKEDAEDAANRTKLQELVASDSLSKILLFPGCLKNTFITSLAGIIVSINVNRTMIENAATSPEVQALLAKQYKSIVYTNSYYLTAEKPRDGFFLNQSIAEFTKELETKNFFSDFVTELCRIITNKVEKKDLFILDPTAPNCKKALRDDTKTWAFTAAHFARYCMLESTLETLFAHFDDCPTAPADIDQTLVPDGTTTDEIKIDGIPVSTLFKSMGDTTFQFMLHLRTRVLELASS